MKLGPFKGSMKEFKNLTENHGFDKKDFFVNPRLETKFLIIPSLILCVALISLYLLANTILALVCIGAGTWLAASTHLRFKNVWAVTVVSIGLIIMILVASGILSLKDGADFFKEIIRGKLD